MLNYLLRRLLLLPITLFCIILVNFIIVNMAPGDPVTVGEISQQGAARREDRSVAFGADERYLQFREFYGSTLKMAHKCQQCKKTALRIGRHSLNGVG